MTTPTQAAAERLIDDPVWKGTYDPDATPGDNRDFLRILRGMERDAKLVAQAYLALLPDWERMMDETLVTVEWLDRILTRIAGDWQLSDDTYIRLRDGRYVVGAIDNEWNYVGTIYTRGQLRSLCRALGLSIECKE